MNQRPMAESIKNRVRVAAHTLGTQDPVSYVGPLIERSFALPAGDAQYGANMLTPGAVAFEPSYSAQEPNTLRFTIEPLGPGSPPISRRDEATREMRRLVGPIFGRDALWWFDQCSEDFRALFGNPRLNFGAWFGSAYDEDGLHASKVYYELRPNQLNALPAPLAALARVAMDTLPALVPVFTTITCQRDMGRQRVTFLHWNPLRLTDLGPLLSRLGLAKQLPSVMQIFGLTFGGRFDLPGRSLFVGLAGALHDPELKLEVALGTLPDLPASFLSLLELGLSERPRELQGLQRWLQAFTPESVGWPGQFSVLSVRVTRRMPARVSLYLRPVEFELNQNEGETPGAESSMGDE